MEKANYRIHQKSGMVIAKRGYCYFVYPDMDSMLADDADEASNLARMNAGLPVHNRCYSQRHVWYTRRLRNAMAFCDDWLLK